MHVSLMTASFEVYAQLCYCNIINCMCLLFCLSCTGATTGLLPISLCLTRLSITQLASSGESMQVPLVLHMPPAERSLRRICFLLPLQYYRVASFRVFLRMPSVKRFFDVPDVTEPCAAFISYNGTDLVCVSYNNGR